MASSARSIDVRDLGLIEYQIAFDLQKKIVASRIEAGNDSDTLLILEHPAVFTLGKRGGRENLTVPESFLDSRGISVVQTQRGGNITYHGPGQLVAYPIIDLQRAKLGVSDFVHCLEEIMITTCRAFGVNACRDSSNHGVWVRAMKIGSIGLTVKKGISFHGLALNVSTDLEPFSWINPCGLHGVSMTSLAAEAQSHETTPEMTSVKSVFFDAFSSLLNMTLNHD